MGLTGGLGVTYSSTPPSLSTRSEGDISTNMISGCCGIGVAGSIPGVDQTEDGRSMQPFVSYPNFAVTPGSLFKSQGSR